MKKGEGIEWMGVLICGAEGGILECNSNTVEAIY